MDEFGDLEICVVGAGRWGKNHVRTLSELGCLGGVVESSEAAIESLREAYPDLRTFRTVDEALEFGFDGFTVATPAETHVDIATKILERSKRDTARAR